MGVLESLGCCVRGFRVLDIAYEEPTQGRLMISGLMWLDIPKAPCTVRVAS